jgi:predicted ATPase/DNA-binding CsgD family transcriptional regulator
MARDLQASFELPARAPHLASLTRRERDIVRLIALGWSNRRIANELVISTSTAERHVANILTKLEMHSRAEIAVWAAEQEWSGNVSEKVGDGWSSSLSSTLSRKTNLPSELSSFVGREREIEELKIVLARSRLLTVTGAGGIGKTRLAMRIASQVAENYSGGVWLVRMDPLTDPQYVPSTVAAVLGALEQRGETMLETLAKVIGTKRLLLTLDNCEHLVQACANLVHELLTACPNLHVLITSREALNVPGEFIWRIPPMSTPDLTHTATAQAVAESDATALFIERARAAWQEFEATDENAEQISIVCRRLDGLPLAIELAAARLSHLSIGELAARLDDRFRLLTTGSRTALQRHQTLRAAIDWSYDLLDFEEQAVLRRLGVFAGGWTLDAAESIVAGQQVEEIDVLQVHSRLVDKSLVTLDRARGAATRYRLLESLAEYARDRLSESGEVADTRVRHVDFYSRFADGAYYGSRGPHQHLWVRRIEDELDNLRGAFEWALVHEPRTALQVVVALERYWTSGNYLGGGRDWITRALQAVPDPDELRARGLMNASFWAFVGGDYDEAEHLGRECVSLGRALGSSLYTGQGLVVLACVEMALRREGWATVALPLCEEAERCLRDANDTVVLTRHLSNIASILKVAGDVKTSTAKAEEAAALARTINDAWLMSVTINSLAGAEFEAGDVSAAEGHWKEALLLAGENRMTRAVMLISLGLARVAWANGAPQRCLRLLATATEIQKRSGWDLSATSHVPAIPLMRSAAQQRLGTEAAETAWHEGTQMSLTQVVRYGVDESGLDKFEAPEAGG